MAPPSLYMLCSDKSWMCFCSLIVHVTRILLAYLYNMAAEPQEISEIQSRFRQELVQEPQCVVVLLGWLGSVDKYVAKYASSLYTPMGCSSVRTTVGGWYGCGCSFSRTAE